LARVIRLHKPGDLRWYEESPLPDDINDGEGALLEPLGVALHALDIGQAPDGATTVDTRAHAGKGLTISLSRRMKPTDLPRAIHLAATGRLQLGSLVTDRYELSEGTKAFASLSERRGLQVLVEPSSREAAS
jgi:L-iditol 2-dehydrogenase